MRPELLDPPEYEARKLQQDGVHADDFDVDARKKGSEARKVPLRRHRSYAFVHFLIFHAVPVAVAVGLIALNVKAHYWSSTGGTWVSALQYVAKIHEMLMQASIVVIVLAYVNHLLTQDGPVPFGAMFASYNVTYMTYLWSPELRATLTSPGFRGPRMVFFAVFVPLNILLAAGVGPSSAVAMQPRFVSFAIPDSYMSLDRSEDDLFPSSFDEAGPALNNKSVLLNELSPAAGWNFLQEIPAVSSDGDAEVGSDGVGLQSNDSNRRSFMPQLYTIETMTYPPYISEAWDSSSFAFKREAYVQFAPNSTFATIQSVQPAANLVFRNMYNPLPHGAKSTELISDLQSTQPYVSVLCQLNSIVNESDDGPFKFPNAFVTPADTYEWDRRTVNPYNLTEYHGINRSQIWQEWQDDPEGRIVWVDDVDVSQTSNSSRTALGAIVVMPQQCVTSNMTFLTTSACTIGGVWADTSIKSTQPGYYSNVGSSVATDTIGDLPEWSQRSVNFSTAWTNSLNPVTTIQNRTVAANVLNAMPVTDNICPEGGVYALDANNNTKTRPYMHEALLAGMVANGMSHTGGRVNRWVYEDYYDSSPGWYSTDEDGNQLKRAKSDPPGVVFQIHGHVPGWAYNLDGIPTKVAVPVLAIYCVYALAYTLYTFVTGRCTIAWRSISDLTALAINSASTEALGHTSAGVGETGTFRKLVGVKAVDSEKDDFEHLEIVFQQDEGARPHKRVARNRAY